MVTMNDVARTAGVSRATVSYALRGDPRIAPTTAERIRQVAQNLHYTANLSARSLRSGKNGVIAVAVSELDRSYPTQIAAAISREAAQHDLQTIVQQTSNYKSDEISILRNVTSQLCDGIIFTPSNITNEEIRSLVGGKPIVLHDDFFFPNTMFDSVNTPCEAGAHAAITHLLTIGRRRLIILGGDLDLMGTHKPWHVAERRIYGCQQALAEAEIPLDADMFLPLQHWDASTARAAAHDLVSSGRQIDGVFCMTDTIALGFIRGLIDMGVRVPDDVAVVGFDGILEGDYAIPSLTTVKVDFDDLAAKAIGLLLARIGGTAPAEPQRLTAQFKLVERESTQR